MALETGQYYTSRVFWGGPQAVKAAEDFVKLANEQVDGSFHVREDGDGNGATVDLDDWPDDEMFNDWFEKWAKRWEVKVHD